MDTVTLLKASHHGAALPKPNRFFSLDSPKAIKAREYGYVNAINYMAPYTSGGAGNLCPDASHGCVALCLGWFSGQAGMVSDQDNDLNDARRSRINKSRAFQKARKAFMVAMVAGIESAVRAAVREMLALCVRPNGASDIPFEGVKCERDGVSYASIFNAFPTVQFVDYTKSIKRMRKFVRGQLPANYHLTFSRSETNDAGCLEILAAGGTVAVVFAGDKPASWNGFTVIDGDKHDLRHLDGRGLVIGLKPKGVKARRDESGFVLRNAA